MEAADRGCIMYVMEVEAGHLHLDGERASTPGAATAQQALQAQQQHSTHALSSASARLLLSLRVHLAQTSRLMVGCMSLVRPP